ncbi:MAG: inositol monophosphatase family protein [Actinomycetes bacterium]|nr:histidinol-phosphatase [Actinomycetota bacterium]
MSFDVAGKTLKYADDLKLAHELADIADKISTARFLATDLKIETKPDLTPVTDADQEIEREIRKILEKQRAADGITGEEFGKSPIATNRRWIIDPIDGTKNYVRGVPVWATLIALMEGDEVVVGVVSAPALFRRWFSQKDGGAYLQLGGGTSLQLGSGSTQTNSDTSSQMQSVRKLSVSGISKLADASLSISTFATPNVLGRNDGWGDKQKGLLFLADQLWRVRGYGDFWSHLLVAEGAIDIAAEPSLALWDMAPLSLIVKEAGGRFSDFMGVDGPNGANAVTTNGLLHAEVLGIFAKR